MPHVTLHETTISGRTPRASGLVGSRALLVLFILSYSAIGIDLLHSSVRTGVIENPYSEYFNRLRYLAIVLSCFLLFRMNFRDQRRALSMGLAFLPFIGAAALSVLTTEETFMAARYVGLLGGLLLGFSVLGLRLGPGRMMHTAMHVLAIVLIASFVLGILLPGFGRHSGMDMLELGHVGRWRGIFGHKNALGGIAAIGCPLFFLYGSILRSPRFYVWLARLAALSCLLFSGSSNSLIGALAIAAAGVLLRYTRIIRPSLLIGGCALLALITVPLVDNLVVSLLGRDETFSGRTVIWEAVILLWQQKPLIGFGYGAGAELIRPQLSGMLFASAVDAHNGYLDILAETGIIGLTTYIALLVVVFRRGFRLIATSRVPDPAMYAATAMLIGSCTMAIGEVAPFRIVGTTGWAAYLAMGVMLAADARKSQGPDP